jgi:site-specific DNA-methyltransferase (adenine-specific)
VSARKRAKAKPATPAVVRAKPWAQCVELADGVTLYQGDCVAVMAALEAESVHAVVTDPPYELGFMGKAWDAAGGVASTPATWARAFDALKPGGHLVAFAGSRTYHRIACASTARDFQSLTTSRSA